MVNRVLRVRWTVFGFVLGMVGAAMMVGAQIGLQQGGGWPAWLTVSLGAVMGPPYILVDVMAIKAGHFDNLLVLPQALCGGLLGGLLGWGMARAEERRSAEVREPDEHRRSD